jgi:hypothetical protein
MNLKSVVKYQIMDGRIAIPVFYLVMFSIMVLFSISVSGLGEGTFTTISGLEMATIIFLFVVGLNAFRETFRMMMQNGVSRKTMFKGYIITVLILSIGMSLINAVLLWVGKAMVATKDNVFYRSLFEQLYEMRYAGNTGGIQPVLEELMFMICLSGAAMMFGYFITTLYYRLNKAGKIAVSISVPGILIVGLPIFDAVVTGGMIYRAFWRFVAFALGLLSGPNPYYAMVSSLLAVALFAAFSWMLVRRAVIKD